MALVNQQIHCGCVILSIDNNNTTVGHLSREFSRLLWHFLKRNECGRQRHSPLIPGGLKIPCYVTFQWKKLVVQARDIIAGENISEWNLPVRAFRMVSFHVKSRQKILTLANMNKTVFFYAVSVEILTHADDNS